MIDKSKICWQKCFVIPKNKLSDFIKVLNENKSEYSEFFSSSIVEWNDELHVVVNEYGHHYPFCSNNIEVFVNKLKKATCIHEPRWDIAGHGVLVCRHCGVKLMVEKWLEL